MSISKASLYLVPPVLLGLAPRPAPLAIAGYSVAGIPLSARGGDDRGRASSHPGTADHLPEAGEGLSRSRQGVQRRERSSGHQYAERRAADWAARGFKETLVDWPALNARSKYWSDEQRAWFQNWEEIDNIRNPLSERQGIAERFMLRQEAIRVLVVAHTEQSETTRMISARLVTRRERTFYEEDQSQSQ